MPSAAPPAILDRRQQFLGFLRARLPGEAEAEAEELLQAAYLKALERGSALRDQESAVAWFYRLLRNALADRSRRRATEERALQAEAAEATEAGDEPLHGAVCQCIGAALDGIAPQSASLVKRVDLEGAGVSEASREAGITANNAGVKLHRARAALRDELRAICGACAAHG